MLCSTKLVLFSPSLSVWLRFGILVSIRRKQMLFYARHEGAREASMYRYKNSGDEHSRVFSRIMSLDSSFLLFRPSLSLEIYGFVIYMDISLVP